jgi:hypothetical protein
MPIDLPPVKRIRWNQTWRIVPSRFPPVGVYDRIADPADIDALFAIEALTNPRLREEADVLKLVPKGRRISGPGSTPVMAAFTHLNPEGSRFSDGTWGVFYAAHSVATAVEETVYHRERFLAATAQPAADIQMRCYRTSVDSKLYDLRGGWAAAQAPDSYVASVALARDLCRQNRLGWSGDMTRIDSRPLADTPAWRILSRSIFPSFNLEKFEAEAHAECREIKRELQGKVAAPVR